MAFRNIEYTQSGVGTQGFADQDRNRNEILQRYLSQQGMGDQIEAQKMQSKNDLIRQQFANQNLNRYSSQMGMQNPSSGFNQNQQQSQYQEKVPNEFEEYMDGYQGMQNPPSSSQRGTIDNPYSPYEYQMMRDAIGDKSTIHWERDSNGNLYGVSAAGIVGTGIKSDPLEMNLKKYDAKRISEYDDIVASAQQTQVNLDEINDIIASDSFKDLRTKDFLGDLELRWYETNGTPAQKEQIASLKTYMGNIVKEASRDFKGSFRAGEQGLLNSMKPNSSDTLPAMKGKASALSYLNKMIQKRAELESRFMRDNGMSYQDAKLSADIAINPEEIKGEVNRILHSDNEGNSDMVAGYSKADLEYTAKENGMTLEEVLRELGV